MKINKKKIKRTKKELIVELNEQLNLLEEAIQKVKSGDFKYVRNLASILRILVIKTKTNTPLLFYLSDIYSIELNVVIDSPFGVKKQTLKDHLKKLYFASGTEGIRMNNEDFIKIASQQDGGVHVDHQIDFGYSFSNSGVLLGGLPPKVYKLRILASHVLNAGRDLLSKLL
jgi:hypothetical protein